MPTIRSLNKGVKRAVKSLRGTRRLNDQFPSAALPKIRSDLCVFLVADSVYLFQAISAPKRARGNDSRSHSRPNTRNHFQFLFRPRVDVDLAEIDFVFCARLLRFNPIHSGIRMDQWRRGRYSGERVRERQGLESSILFDHEDTKERRLLGMYVHAPCPYAPASDFLLLRFMLEFLKFFYLNSRVFYSRRHRFEPVISREAIANQLLTQIAVFGLYKRIKPLELAVAHRIGHARKYRKRLRQFLSGELFRCLAHVDGLRHSDRKILRLFDQAPRCHFVRFRRINHVQTKNVFSRACTRVKTVAVIRWI